MSSSIATKAELLALIERGPTGVAAIPGTNKYRVGVPEDADASRGVWISLSPAPKYAIEDYETAIARVGKRDIRLTKAEAKEIRDVIVAAMRLRAIPWRIDSARVNPMPRRRTATR
jgi:hypothetical protein